MFEDKQKNLVVKYCSVCHEINLDEAENICKRCSTYPDPNSVDLNDVDQLCNLNPFSSVNNMYPGQIPECLLNLSLFEQTLISPVKPFIHIIRIHNRQYHYSNQVISFNQNIIELVSELPHALSSLSQHVIIRRENSSFANCKDIRVRREKVRNALQYLVTHNKFYQNIAINDHNLNQIPINSTIEQHLTQILDPNETFNEETNPEEIRPDNQQDSNRLVEEELAHSGKCCNFFIIQIK